MIQYKLRRGSTVIISVMTVRNLRVHCITILTGILKAEDIAEKYITT